MAPKAHGTTEAPPQAKLRYGCDHATADKICCFNRHYAEHRGYFQGTKWLDEVDPTVVTTYYDSVSGKPLFKVGVRVPELRGAARLLLPPATAAAAAAVTAADGRPPTAATADRCHRRCCLTSHLRAAFRRQSAGRSRSSSRRALPTAGRASGTRRWCGRTCGCSRTARACPWTARTSATTCLIEAAIAIAST
eukprot:SAG31_NODE_9732_length_1235_cov_2.771127_1_plen_193_part_00